MKETENSKESLTGPPCILCGNTQYQLLYTKPFGNIVQSADCNLVVALDRSTNQYVSCSYDEAYFNTANLESSIDGGYMDYFGKEWESRNAAHEGFANILASLLKPNAKVLDIGSGGGQFLNHMKNRGMSGQGVELSAFAANESSRRFGISVFNGTIKEFLSTLNEPVKYDLITLFDVIEHFPDPVAELSALSELLAPGGRVFATTPQFGGRLSTEQGENYFQFKQDHIFYFTPETLKLAFIRGGINTPQFFNFPDLAQLSTNPVPKLLYQKYTEEREHIFALSAPLN